MSWPAMVSLLAGATTALVMPFSRATGINSVSAWKASATCMCGMISSEGSARSLLFWSDSISVSPKLVSGSMRPG